MTTEQYRHRPDETPTQWPVLMICDYIPERSFVCANLRQFESLNGFDGWQPLALLPAAPTGSHASAGAEKGDGISLAGKWSTETQPTPVDAGPVIGKTPDAKQLDRPQMQPGRPASESIYAPPASPAVAEPATEGAALGYDEKQMGRDILDYIKQRNTNCGDRPTRDEQLAFTDGCAHARQQLTAKLKEAEAKLAEYEKRCPYYDLYVAETKAHNACALREQALLKDTDFAGREIERLEADKEQAVARERESCAAIVPKLTEIVDFLYSEGCTTSANQLHALSQRLTQPANRSDSRNANPCAEGGAK